MFGLQFLGFTWKNNAKGSVLRARPAMACLGDDVAREHLRGNPTVSAQLRDAKSNKP